MFNGPDTPVSQSGSDSGGGGNGIAGLLGQLSKMLSGAGQIAGGGGQGGQPQKTGTPGQQIPPSAVGGAPPMVPGSMAAGLPQYSPGAAPVPPKSAVPQGSLPAYNTGFNFPNPKARNAAIVTNAIQSLGAFADQQKQHAYQKQVEEARGVIATVLRSSLAADKAGQTGDQDTQKLIQEQANKMLGNKEAQKVLKELNKPGSAAYYGAQQAYQDIMKENEQRLSMEEIRTKIQAQLAQKNAEDERAKAEAQRARSESPEGKIQIGHAEHQDKMEEIATTQAEMDKRVNAQQQGAMDRTIQAGKDSIEVARIRASLIRAATDPKIAKALTDQYNAYGKDMKDLMDQAGKIQKDLSDHPIQNWNSPEAAAKKAQIDGINIQMQTLRDQMGLLSARQQKLLQYGLIQMGDASNTSNSTISQPTPSVEQNATGDSENNPIVLK